MPKKLHLTDNGKAVVTATPIVFIVAEVAARGGGLGFAAAAITALVGARHGGDIKNGVLKVWNNLVGDDYIPSEEEVEEYIRVNSGEEVTGCQANHQDALPSEEVDFVAQTVQPQPHTQRSENGNDLDDLARPKQRGPFLMSEVLRSFTPTLDKIYLATLPNGKHLFCEYQALCHVALAGATDAGKSNIMRMIVMQLCYAGAKVLILNPHWTGYVLDKQEDWTPIIPYLYDDPMECRKYEKIDYYLNYIANTTVPHRLDLFAYSKPTGKPIFIVLDELPAIVKWSKKHNKDIPGCLDTILKEGRKLGIYLISAAQDFLVDTIGGTGAVRDCYRTAYSVGGDDTTTNKLLGKTKADRPLGKGVVLLRNASNDLCKEAVTALVPYVDNASLRLLGPTTYQPSMDTEELEDFGKPLENTAAAAKNAPKTATSEGISTAAAVLPDGWTDEEADWAKKLYKEVKNKDTVIKLLEKKGANARLRAELDQVLQQE